MLFDFLKNKISQARPSPDEVADIQLNLKLPGYKNKVDLIELSRRLLAFQRPLEIVDVGSSTGIATWHLAKNSPRGSRIYAIDPWKGEDFNANRNSFCNNWEPWMLNTFELFQKNTADCQNIFSIKGKSPECWTGQKVDFVFLDLDMGPDDTQRAVEKNLLYWQDHLNPGGLLCGFHYAPKNHPDYKNTKLWYRIPVEEHARRFNYDIENPDYTWLWFLIPKKY